MVAAAAEAAVGRADGGLHGSWHADLPGSWHAPVMPRSTPRASSCQWGANSPPNAGTKYTPPVSGTCGWVAGMGGDVRRMPQSNSRMDRQGGGLHTCMHMVGGKKHQQMHVRCRTWLATVAQASALSKIWRLSLSQLMPMPPTATEPAGAQGAGQWLQAYDHPRLACHPPTCARRPRPEAQSTGQEHCPSISPPAPTAPGQLPYSFHPPSSA